MYSNVVCKKVSFCFAMFIVLCIAVTLILGIAVIDIGVQATFLLCIVETILIAKFSGISITACHDYFIEGCKKAVMIAMILMSAGTVIGAWMISGIVPAVIYYGLKILTPSLFLATGFIVCCVTSFFTGSSYSCVATLGVAFLGIGFGLDIPPALTTGMVVSGAIFGDKMSPFSDTTNIASAVAEVNIFDHIESMLYTTGPAFVISLILYIALGLKYGGSSLDMSKINIITDTIAHNFNVNPLLLIVPLFTIYLAVKKVPPVISLLAGALAGVIAALIFQSGFGVKAILSSINFGFSIDTGVFEVDKLLNRGGIMGMMSTVSITLLALGFGGLLSKIGVLSAILSNFKGIQSNKRKLVIGTVFTLLLATTLTVSQSVPIIVVGETFKESYKKLKLSPTVLSRTLEDGGTIFSFLVPWSAAALYVKGVLDVGATQYVPYAFLAILCPVLAILYAIIGFAQFKLKEDHDETASEVRES